MPVESQEVLGLAFTEAVICKFEFDGGVVERGEFVVHGLHDLEASGEVVASML